MNIAYMVVWVVLIFLHVMFSTGLLPIAVVMILYLISMLTFSIKAHQLNTVRK